MGKTWNDETEDTTDTDEDYEFIIQSPHSSSFLAKSKTSSIPVSVSTRDANGWRNGGRKTRRREKSLFHYNRPQQLLAGKQFLAEKQQKRLDNKKNKIEGFMPPLSLARDVRVGYSVDAPMSMVPNAAFRSPSVSYRGSLKHFNDSENRFMMNADGTIEEQKSPDLFSATSQIGATNRPEQSLDIELPPVIYDRLMYAPQRSKLYAGGDAIRGDLAIEPSNHGGWFDVSVNPETDLRSGAMGILIGHNNEAGRELAALKSKYTLGLRNHYLGPTWDEDDKPMSRETLPLYQDLLKLK